MPEKGSISRRIRFNIIPKEHESSLMGNIFDAVIYDDRFGYACTDTTIERATPFIQMQEGRIDDFLLYASQV